MTEPEVSVIVPCYKQASFLPETFASLLEQTHRNWECIIVNDGSPDDTGSVAREWMARDSRFRYVEKTNGGLSSARNAGLDVARGSFIQFLDSDDALLPRKLLVQLEKLRAEPGMSLAYCDYRRGSEANIHREPDPARYMSPRQGDAPLLLQLARYWESKVSIPPHCFLFDARVFRDHGVRFDTSLQNHEDWDCWMRIASLPINVFYCDEVLVLYRFHLASMSRSRAPMRDGYLKAIDKQMGLHRGDAQMMSILADKRVEAKKRYSLSRAIKKRIRSAIRLP